MYVTIVVNGYYADTAEVLSLIYDSFKNLLILMSQYVFYPMPPSVVVPVAGQLSGLSTHCQHTVDTLSTHGQLTLVLSD